MRQTTEIVKGTERQRAVTYIWRYYRQKPDGSDTRLVLTHTGSARPQGICLDSGALLLVHRGRIVLVSPDGNTVDRGKDYFRVAGEKAMFEQPHRFFAKGFTVSIPGESQHRKYYFVPIVDDRPVADKVAPLCEAKERREFVLHGDKLVWMTMPKKVHVWNIQTNGRRSVDLEGEFHPSCNVTAFDGKTVMVGPLAFDAQTGKKIGRE